MEQKTEVEKVLKKEVGGETELKFVDTQKDKMSFKEKLKMAWEDKKREKATEKKLENEIYERKKYTIEMDKQAEKHTKTQERAEQRAEYRAQGGHLGAVKRGAKQTGRGLGKMANTGFDYGVKTIKAQSKKPREKSRSNNYNPFGMANTFGFGSTPKPRKSKTRRSTAPNIIINVGGVSNTKRKTKRRRKKKNSDPFGFGFGNIKL